MKLADRKSIETPEVTYDIVVDFGEDGTQTIYSSKDEKLANLMLDCFMTGDYRGLDIDEDNAKDVIGISLNQTIEAPSDNVSVVTFGNTQQVFIELFSAKVVQ